MSNLSDLLPAGAAAKQLTFTDSGSGISSKAPVVLNSDGTVSGITLTSNPVAGGTATSFGGTGASGYVYYPAIVYDSANNKMVIFYEDQGNSRYGTAVVATTSGTSISYGTPIVFNSGTTTYINATYDPDTSQTVTVYKDETNSNYGTAIVGSVSGTSISFGSEAVYASSNVYYNNVTYDTTNDKVIVVYMDYSASQYGYGAVGTVSGTSISFGTATVFESGSSNYISICYDSSTDRSVIFFQDNDDSSKGKVVVGTTSGTSISFGSAVTFEATQAYETASVFDSTANRAVVVFRTGGGDTQIVAGEVSGTSITVGTSVMVGSGAPYYGKGIAFDSNAGKTVIPFENASGNAVYRLASVSGTTPSVDSEVTFNTPGGSLGGQLYAAYNSTDRVAVFTYAPTSDYLGYATVVRPVAFDESNLTATNFVGVADSAISASAAGSVIVQGGTVSGVAGPSTLSAGSPVTYLSAGGYYGAIAYDTNSDKVVVVNRDDSSTPTGYGVAYVGTVSGTSISYGTQVVFNSGTATDYIDICFDASNNTVVVVYKDGGNSGYGTAIVGTVAGGNITFGSEVVFNSASTDACKVVYDSSNNKVVVSYRDTGNSNYGTAIVGTVSGTSISFGTAAVFDSQAIEADNGSAIAFDTSSNQAIIVYRETATYYINAVTGSVSGTSITFGTPVDISVGGGAGAYHDYPSVCYDSTANKLLFAFRESSSAGAGLAKVGTVSGTAISVGTVVQFSAKAKYTSSVFNTSLNQVVISYQEYGTTTYGYLVKATISGTDVTFSTPEVWSGTTPVTYLGTVYDPDTQSIVSTFADSAASYYGKSIVAKFSTDLTVGTKYYVTTSGGFSSSADTPSVNAGLAISTTSLLLNGDS